MWLLENIQNAFSALKSTKFFKVFREWFTLLMANSTIKHDKQKNNSFFAAVSYIFYNFAKTRQYC